jgi:flagellar assembly protein FliH
VPPPPPVFEVPADLVQAIYEDAVLRGLEEGKAQVMSELKVLQERFASALDQLDHVSRQLVDRNRVTLIGLACRIAERLVRHQLSVHPEHLLGLVREAITSLDEKDEVVVHCGPQDHAYLTERRADLAAGMGDAFRVKVMVDENLEYGDFRVETRTGAADGRLATRMGEVHESLLGLGEG